MFSFAAAGSVHIASQSFELFEPAQERRGPGVRFFPRKRRESSRLLWAAVLLLCCLAAPMGAIAQNPTPNTGGNTTPPPAPKPAGPAQKIPRVTTTVVVHGETQDEYLPEAVTVGNLDGMPLEQAPLSATVVTRELLNDQGARVLSDVVKNDASIGEDYAPVGYYGDFEVRGFPIDLATGLEINGMTIAGEQDVPLENKQSVEFLKGIAGVESGVASAGGLIDYVTKRPTTIEAVDLASDHRGSTYGAVDLGHLFGSRKQVGARINLAGEKIMSYVNDANGWRAVGAGAADWHISPKAILKGDFEYQHKVERSVCGYQLLGGTTVPDLQKVAPNYEQVYPSTMLGEQSWAKPNTFDTFNTSSRLDYDLPHAWHAFSEASYSHSLIDDNVVYAYGCYNEAECNSGSVPYPWFFAPDGTYDIYDYRDPGELRIDAQAEALITGHVKTGAITHDLAGGGDLFLRSVQQPGFYTVQTPSTPAVGDGAVYYDIGSENIFQPITPVDLASVESPLQSAGPRRLWEDSHQSSAVMQDRIHLPAHIQLLASGRFDSLRDHNYSPYASCASFILGPGNVFETPENCLPKLTNKTIWLPQYAVTYNPINTLTLYGNYGVMLSLGPQAPFWTDNGSQFLDPFMTRQAEIGAKYEPGQRILLSTALFHMRAPFFYPKVIQAFDNACGPNEFDPTLSSNVCFESEGRETHDGIELNAEGKATNRLRLTASAAAIRAISSDTGTPAFDHKQVLNAPHLRTAMFADVLVLKSRGLHLMPGWSYTGRKEATRDDLVSVPGYNIFNLGARYTPGGEQGRLTLRLYADNITDKRYWKDTGASYGDTFIHLGAPTTVRLSAHYTF
jgi:iron complex outermembrane receptor protein